MSLRNNNTLLVTLAKSVAEYHQGTMPRILFSLLGEIYLRSEACKSRTIGSLHKAKSRPRSNGSSQPSWGLRHLRILQLLKLDTDPG